MKVLHIVYDDKGFLEISNPYTEHEGVILNVLRRAVSKYAKGVSFMTPEKEQKFTNDWQGDEPIGTCMHCGRTNLTDDEGRVCSKCYSLYTPGMLADLEG